MAMKFTAFVQFIEIESNYVNWSFLSKIRKYWKRLSSAAD